MERYIGLDAHGTSCTFAVVGPSGRNIRYDVVETNGAALVRYLKGLSVRKHFCLEEGTQHAWLYEILSPHVDELAERIGIAGWPFGASRCASLRGRLSRRRASRSLPDTCRAACTRTARCAA